jgi:ribosomal protein S18 acetylase RimI-like enzyme
MVDCAMNHELSTTYDFDITTDGTIVGRVSLYVFDTWTHAEKGCSLLGANSQVTHYQHYREQIAADAPEKIMVLSKIRICDQHQKRGFGTKAMSALMHEFRRRGCGTGLLHVSPETTSGGYGPAY